MKRLLRLVLWLIFSAILIAPLWFMAFPAPYPPELPRPGVMTYLTTHHRVNMVKQGEGEPVVLVHGLPGSAYDWRETDTEIAKLNRRTVAYDRVGYGYSNPRTNRRYTPESNAEDLLGLLQSANLREPTVVGWSYGGMVGMLAALQDPDAIRRLVLVGTAGPDSADAKAPEPSMLLEFFYSTPMLKYRTAVPPLGRGLMKLLSNAAFSGGPQPDWWLPGVEANFARWDTLITYREEMLNIGAEGGEFDPSKITVPTLILHGDDDQLADVAVARYLASVIPNAKLVIYPGASHMLPVTHAKEIAKEIVEFSK